MPAYDKLYASLIHIVFTEGFLLPWLPAAAGSEEDCQQATAAAARLEGALNNALACLRGAVAGMALLDTAHWEVRSGRVGVRTSASPSSSSVPCSRTRMHGSTEPIIGCSGVKFTRPMTS